MRISFFGAAPDTGNLGVSALCYATLYQLLACDPSMEITVFDYGRGRREQQIDFGNGTPLRFHCQGAMHSRRYYRPENLQLMQLAGFLGGVGNPGINTIAKSDAVLDISGGDSFTDLYGSNRFVSVTLPKRLALQQKRPLVLLPQTYGPFADSACERKASDIVKRSLCAWARDSRSFEILKHLLGSSFDSSRHRCGVDVAFGLPTMQPRYLPQNLADILSSDAPKIGINVSGLIYNDFAKARIQFGIKADYPQAVLSLVRRILAETDCTIILVPHVVTPKGHYESDLDACLDLTSRIGAQEGHNRLFVCPSYDNPCTVKWIISKMDWFCGTRMHATIAALSSGVPVSAISYSPKALGVFETCGLGEHVADPQTIDTPKLIARLWTSWETRRGAKSILAAKLPIIKFGATEQITSILSLVAQ